MLPPAEINRCYVITLQLKAFCHPFLPVRMILFEPWVIGFLQALEEAI
jgi:hypothetical protein